MKRLSILARPQLWLLALVALLLFGNCSQNIYYLLGPGTTPQQVASLRQLQQQADSIPTRLAPPIPGQPTARQRYDSLDAARRRLLSPAQYARYRHSILRPRYPRRPPKGYR